jgi:hypothetical protein
MTRDFIVLGNPWYTRSIGLRSGAFYFIKNFDFVYSTVRHAPVAEVSAEDRKRFKEAASLGEAGEQLLFAIPATSYDIFTVTVDVVPEAKGCAGKFSVSMPPGFPYFATTIDDAPRTRLQFSAARLDALRLAIDAKCKARVYYRLDRPGDAPRAQGTAESTQLFATMYAERKHRTSDELYDLENDAGMKRNLITDPSLADMRRQLERKTQKLYTQIYGAVFDHRRTTPVLPPEEIEKLKSLGYLF